MPDEKKSNSKLRIALVAVGVLAVALASGYLLMNRFPNAFDRESADAAQIEKLKSMKLADVVAKPESGWPQWRGPNRDGRAPAGPFRANWDKRPLRELFSVPCKGGYATCTVVGGKLYTLDYDAADKSERLICLDANDGTPLWESSAPAEYGSIGHPAGPRSTPAVHGGRVYTVGATGQFACTEANPAKGQPAQEHWRIDLVLGSDLHSPNRGPDFQRSLRYHHHHKGVHLLRHQGASPARGDFRWHVFNECCYVRRGRGLVHAYRSE